MADASPEVEEVSTESPKGEMEVELQRSFSVINEEAGTPWGGGVEGLTVKVGILASDIENLREGCQRLAGESEEILQAIFERLGILHCRTSRIETIMGLPPWQPDEDEAMRTQEEGDSGGPRCLRGHPLEPEEEVDGPPKQCGFCKCQRQTHFRCSEGCYFHACQECVLQKVEAEGAERQPKDPAEECEASATPKGAQETTTEPTQEPTEVSGQSPSNTSDEADLPRQACQARDDPKERSSRPQTPSTASPEDATETGSGVEVDSSYGAEVPDETHEVQEPEPSRPPKLPKEGNGLKARLCALEAEVKELAAFASSTAAKEAAALAQEAAAACCSELQEEVMNMSTSLKTEVKAWIGKLQEELRDRPSSQEKGAPAEHGGRETFQEELAEFAEAVDQQLLRMAESMQKFILESQEESEQRITKVSQGCQENVEGLSLRLDLLEKELPRGRVRASKGKPEKVEDREVAFQGLAGGFGALVKCLGLANAGELLGQQWPWDQVEQRIEEAWLRRGKEAWHLGLPPKPDLFDFLQCQAASARAEAAKAPRLPDRREAARLASRLASTSPAGSYTGSCGTLSYSPQSSIAGADARTDVDEATSPKRPRSAVSPGLGTPPTRHGYSAGADLAWADREMQDSRPLDATSSRAAQRFREVLLGRA